MMPEARLWSLAVVFLAAFAILGILVISTRAFNRIDALSTLVRGRSTGLAALLTRSGRAMPLLGLGALSVLLFFILKKPLWIPVAIFASQVASQGVAELILKHRFSRIRPGEWLINQEIGFSFPSGHATTAVVFFGAWVLYVLASPIDQPLKIGLAVVLVAWAIGIDWSRIALGAHYISDILGGTLFGCAWMCGWLALLTRLHYV